MIGFAGKSNMKQFMINKPVKLGFKVFAVCEAKSGYLWNWRFYKGKENEEIRNNLTIEVVLDLLSALKNRDYIVYMDRFYTSPKLFTLLYKNGIIPVGTVQINRKGLPDYNKESKKLTRF